MDIVILPAGRKQTNPTQFWESFINSFTGLKCLLRFCEKHAQSQALKYIITDFILILESWLGSRRLPHRISSVLIWKTPLLLGDWERAPEPHGRTGKLFPFVLEREKAGVLWRRTEVEETLSSYAV